MGVDCRVLLPADTRASDVAKAIAILLGAEKSKLQFSSGGWCTQTEAEVKSNAAVPECANLVVPGDTFLYHYEAERGQRLLIRRSYAKNIALFCRLAKFFGGAVDFNDCDDHYDRFYGRPLHRPINDPEDGAPWTQLQSDLLNLEPLTDNEVAEYVEYAAYGR